MAYGNTAALNDAAAHVDDWIQANALNLYSAHSPLIARIMGRSKLPGGDFNFRKLALSGGENWRIPVFGNADSTVVGVTRANQINNLTPAITTGGITNSIWTWAAYQGLVTVNHQDEIANQPGDEQKVSYIDTILARLRATFFDTVDTDFWDDVIGTRDKIQSVTQCLLNTGSPGGIDQTDTVNNSWWRAQGDSTSETINTTTFNRVANACEFDTGLSTGMSQLRPDIAFFSSTSANGDLFSTFMEILEQSQRVQVESTIKGGATSMRYRDIDCYRNTRMTAGQVAIMNSASWIYRYETMMPKGNSEGFYPDPYKPMISLRGYYWCHALGCQSPKHNGLLQNKTAD